MIDLQPAAVIGGIALYEHPKYGDEMLFKIDGAFVSSDLFNEQT